MAWIDAFAPVEAAHRAAVMADTWGHLAPRKNKTYRGRVVYAVGCYDSCNPVILSTEFRALDGTELDDSPWLYDALNELVMDLVSGSRTEAAGLVFEWIGKFRNYEFTGVTRCAMDSNRKELTYGKE